MEFKLGQKVLCVNNHFNHGQSRLKKGSVYTIHGFYQCACRSRQVTLFEIPDVTNMGCKCHRTSVRRQSYYNWRFIPLEYFEKFMAISSKKKELVKEPNGQNVEPQKEVITKNK